MHITAIRRSLIAAVAILGCFAGTAQACNTPGCAGAASTQAAAGKPLALGKYVKHRSRHSKKAAFTRSRHSGKKLTRKSSRTQKTAEVKKDAGKDIGKKEAAKTSADKISKTAENSPKEMSNPSALSPSVANARGELNSSDWPTTDQSTTVTGANAPSSSDLTAQNGAEATSANTLNDLDRAAAENTTAVKAIPAAPTTIADVNPTSNQIANPTSNQIASSRDEDSDTWGKTSLIGKIFVAFGGLLTLASAARMFIA